jgi:hypothetical protein
LLSVAFGCKKNSEVEFPMNDTMPEFSLMVIGVASMALLDSGAYPFVRWLRNTEHPWESILAVCRKVLPFLQLHGIGVMILAAGFFLARQLLYDQLRSADRSFFARMAWTCLLGGVGFVAAAGAGRQIAARTQTEEEAPRATP